ncbi:MAG: 50S ribosomal protein L10 [Ignisphaera sp.]
MKIGLKKELEKLVKVYKTQKKVIKEEKTRPSLEEKRVVIEETKKLLTKYRTLILLEGTGVPSKLYLHMRRMYGDIFYIKMIKNKLLLKALNELGMPNTEEVAKYLTGPNVAVFTNLNAFEAKLIMDKIAITHRVKPGDKIENEIIVPPTRTELKPGPIMSLFGRLKIPIQVRDGVIWIMREATIAKPGDTVTQELASLLDKLGIEPKLLKPKIKLAYERGLVIPADKLVIDVEGVKSSIIDGIKSALSLAVEFVVPEPDIVRLAISRAYARACNLAIETGIVTRDIAPLVFRAALMKVYTLASILAQRIPELSSAVPTIQVQQVQQKLEETKEVKEEKKEEKAEALEEQLAEGLAALFG